MKVGEGVLVYKYNILERVLVENIIFRGMIFRLAHSPECYIYFNIPNIISLFSYHGVRSSKDNAMRNCYE